MLPSPGLNSSFWFPATAITEFSPVITLTLSAFPVTFITFSYYIYLKMEQTCVIIKKDDTFLSVVDLGLNNLDDQLSCRKRGFVGGILLPWVAVARLGHLNKVMFNGNAKENKGDPEMVKFLKNPQVWFRKGSE